MAQFSTNELISLEKTINSSKIHVETNPDDVAELYEIERCAEWIASNNFKKVCLQFPDYLLPDSYAVATRLQNLLGQTVYVMGDSTYESCCVDYVTAQHVDSDAIVHFGSTCFSKWTNKIPYLCIYEKDHINIGQLKDLFCEKFNKETQFLIILDTPYVYKIDELTLLFDDTLNVKIVSIEEYKKCDDIVLYVGRCDRKLLNFQLIFRPRSLYCYDPSKSEPTIENYKENDAILKRRRFLIEKIRDSHTVCIVIAALFIQNFIGAIKRIKKLLKLHSKTYYTLSVGRPTVAKLANFPEMDVYVLITCPMDNIVDNRDFYKPIVTPYDVEIALNPHATNTDFTYGLNYELNDELDEEALKRNGNTPDVSLLSGNIRFLEEIPNELNVENQISLKNDGTVALNSGAGFLGSRTFRGLEQNLGLTEVKMAEEGKKGIAERYVNENF